MADTYDRPYDRYDTESHGAGFMMGLLAGTVLGAGLGMLLAPKAGADLRGQIGEQARTLGNRASEQYRRASETASSWAERGREMVQDAQEAVSHAADQASSGNAGGSYGSGTYGGSTGTTGSSGSFGGQTPGSDYGRS